jgi:hypothetical protein
VIIHEVCVACGLKKITDTWAQNPEDGTQGLTSVRYETSGDVAEHLATIDCTDRDGRDTVDEGDGWEVSTLKGPWGWWAVVTERHEREPAVEWFRGEEAARLSALSATEMCETCDGGC